MKRFLILLASCFLFLAGQTNAQYPDVPNGGFENWEGSGTSTEPVNWNSNKTGGGSATLGPQTCFNETSNPHSGSSCVRIESKLYLYITVVNGSCTTGRIEAPSTNKAEGYVHSRKNDPTYGYSFNGRPDSIIGYYRYTSVSSDYGKIGVFLHVGNYYDPETPVNNNHPDSSVNKIASGAFFTPSSSVANWTRFSIPLTYYDARTPQYILISMTSSGNQTGGSNGSKLWVDDLKAFYNPVLTTGTISPSTYVVDASNGASINIPFTLTGTMNAGNIVTAQLSDASGSFASPVTLGTLTTTTSGTVAGTIPAGTPTGSGYRIRVVSSNYALTAADNGSNISITLTGTGHNLSGKTVYVGKANTGNPAPNPPTYNAVQYAIDNVIVIMKSVPGGAEIARDTSNGLGVFQFSGVPDGEYKLSYHKYAADTMQAGNDVNAIDVALTKYFIGADTLADPSRNFSAKYKKAVNVDNNSSVNAVDIARIKAKVGSPYLASKNFPKGNWVTLDTNVIISGADLNIKLKTICYGDYNGSSIRYRDSVTNWAAAKMPTKKILDVSDDYIFYNDPAYFEIPLRISNKMKDFSALGLELNYPNHDYRLEKVTMPRVDSKNEPSKINPTLDEIIADDNDILVTDENGVIRIVFATTNHFDVEANDELIMLGFRSIKDVNPGVLDFSLTGTGVIGDQYGSENEDAYLIMPKIFIQGNNNESIFEFSAYPNPVNSEAAFTYIIPDNGTVRLSAYNTLGEQVSELINESQEKGKHSVSFSLQSLPSGMYTFTLEYTGKDTSKCMVLKLIH